MGNIFGINGYYYKLERIYRINMPPYCWVFVYEFRPLLIVFRTFNYSQTCFRYIIRVSNRLDPDLIRRFVGPGQDPNCLQRVSGDDKSRH